jgi:hypothetical protein
MPLQHLDLISTKAVPQPEMVKVVTPAWVATVESDLVTFYLQTLVVTSTHFWVARQN